MNQLIRSKKQTNKRCKGCTQPINAYLKLINYKKEQRELSNKQKKSVKKLSAPLETLQKSLTGFTTRYCQKPWLEKLKKGAHPAEGIILQPPRLGTRIRHEKRYERI